MYRLTSRDSARLEAAGYLKAGTSVRLTGSASLMLEGWRRLLRGTLASAYEEEVQTPAFIDRNTLVRSRYLAHFPQQVLGATNVRAASAPRPLSPAVCLHFYPTLRGRRLGTAQRCVLVEGPVARYEAAAWRYPFRLASFRMAELVTVGTESGVERIGQSLKGRMSAAFGALGLHGSWRPASDPFFGPQGKGARAMQALSGSKEEYWPAVAPVAVASLNLHGETFGRAFEIRAADQVAHSACLAFGLERLTAASILLWGTQPAHWPPDLRP